MRAGGGATRRAWALSAAVALLAAPGARAGDAAAPTVERVQLDEQAGRVEEALAGWAARALAAEKPAERADALRRYVALASKHAASADPYLADAVSRSGAGIRLVAGRRIVIVAPDEAVGAVDGKVLAALADAYSIAIERIAGARAPCVQIAKQDKRLRDAAGRYVVGVWPIPKPVADEVFDAWRNAGDPATRGAALAYDVAASLAQACLYAAPNRRAPQLGPAVTTALRDLAARAVADAAGVALADEARKEAKQAFEKQWAPGCLPCDSAAAESAITHLFLAALDAGRASGNDAADTLRKFLTEPRREAGWGRGRVASGREAALEPFATSMPPEAVALFRRAGVLPAGPAYDEMLRRVAADDTCREADTLRSGETEGTAARMFRAAADSVSDSPLSEELLLEALAIEERTEPKKARAAAQKLGLIQGFDFLGPLPDVRPKDNLPVAQRLMPLAVATAPSRLPFKLKDPVEVSFKWDEVKDVYDHLVQRTPWADKKGTSWGGATIAAIRWPKDMGRVVRIRPCRDGWSNVLVLADGRPVEPWPDGSSIVPGAKGTEILLTSAARITCSLPWRDAKTVDEDLAAAAADADPPLALRPWAARRVALAVPAIVAALTKLPDADFQRHAVLLAPFHGGDAAACDALLAHANSRPAVLAAYLGTCRGTRDPAVLDRLVALAAAPDAPAEVQAGVQAVLETTLFRKVTEKGPALAALWERGRKWLATTVAAEGEEVRDLIEWAPCFRASAGAGASGAACLAPSGTGGGRGEGYLCVDVPEGAGTATLTVRWRPVGAGRLTLHGTVTDGRKPRPFSIDVPAPAAGADGVPWTSDAFDLGPIPRGRVVIALDDPCASGCEIDAFAVGAKPLE
jgi:hypothetical protein